jgi:hypothetical protein
VPYGFVLSFSPWYLHTDIIYYFVLPVRERIEPGFAGSSSVRFGLVFKNTVRARFGSNSFYKKLFGFGSVRFDFIFRKAVRVRFGSTLLALVLPNQNKQVTKCWHWDELTARLELMLVLSYILVD